MQWTIIVVQYNFEMRNVDPDESNEMSNINPHERNNEQEEHKSSENEVSNKLLQSKSTTGNKGNWIRSKCKHFGNSMDRKPQRMKKHLVSVCENPWGKDFSRAES